MANFKKLEEDLKAKVEELVEDAKAHEPEIDTAVMSALTAVGAPSVVASAAGQLINSLLAHFKGETPASEAAAEQAGTGLDWTGGGAEPAQSPTQS